VHFEATPEAVKQEPETLRSVRSLVHGFSDQCFTSGSNRGGNGIGE